MVRPCCQRHLCFSPRFRYFKPQGVPLRLLKEVNLFPDEFEAIKLHDVDGLNHQQSASAMKISQSTFSRILNRAYSKIAQALICGHAIRLQKK